MFDSTGAGNNIHIIRFLDKMAEKLVEGEPVKTTASGTIPNNGMTMDSIARDFYSKVDTGG